ncbi:MAG: homoserine dehydrogenase [Candidatus Azotimanducaceae bacterium]|uniref:Homoserine dehydrogenase n=1 Tax=OM182 bacterium TaxID=2510334 RepID=A0A520S1I8_9GAMM|nr:homoserine dehydrogenase [Gammaproteobacteria bacterium]RZO76326.1 MAG: homoserine dehydrogenase [OM182 bacterium]
MKVGICGLGTVGSGTFNLILKNNSEIERRIGNQICVAQVGCRRDHPDCDLSDVHVTRDVFDVVRNPDIDIVIEVIGGIDVARALVLEAISNNKHVVTANKALIAEHGQEIMVAASEKGVQVKFEAAVAGGIPIVKAIREGMAANKVEWIIGIINGTSNYILSKMTESGGSLSFVDVLKDAQELGYAEADPTFDVEGIDAAHKLTILSSIAFGAPLRFDAIFTEGITQITSDDIDYAGELGFVIKHLGIARNQGDTIAMRVHPCLVAADHMLAQVKGVMNAVVVGGDAAGPTMYYGAGAGSLPTASAIISDVVDIVRSSGANIVENLGFEKSALISKKVVMVGEVVSRAYLRLIVSDQPGVMARISTILSQHKISIESLIQKNARAGYADVVIITNAILEETLDIAVRKLSTMDDVKNDVKRIRIADFFNV